MHAVHAKGAQCRIARAFYIKVPRDFAAAQRAAVVNFCVKTILWPQDIKRGCRRIKLKHACRRKTLVRFVLRYYSAVLVFCVERKLPVSKRGR